MATRLRMPPETSAGYFWPMPSTRRAGTHADSPRLRLRLALPYRPDEVVPDEDQDGGENDGLRGRACHALGAVADVEAFVGAHPRDDHTERVGLPEAERDVG